MIKFLKRFFEPALLNLKCTAGVLFESTVSSVWFDIIPLFSIPLLIKYINAGEQTNILYLSLAILAIYSILWVLHFFIRYLDLSAKHLYNFEIEKKYRENFILKNNVEMEKLGTGKVQSIIQKGVYAWSDGAWQIIYQIPRTLIALISGVYITFGMGWQYVLLFFIFLAFSTVFFSYFRKKRLTFEEKINEIEDVKNSNSTRIIMSRIEILFSGKEKEEIKKLNEFNMDQYKKDAISAKYEFLSDLSISGMSIAFPFLFLIAIVLADRFSGMSVAVLVAFIYFSVRLAFFMYSALWMVREFYDKYPKIKILWDFIDKIPEIKNYKQGEIFVHGGGEIVLQNVAFSYGIEKLNKKQKEIIETEVIKDDEDENDIKIVLENLNLKIDAGQKIALIGRSGSGKTTIAKLISGYMSPTKGKVFIDGQDLSKVSLQSYYKYLGYLTQEPMVFDGSIKDNLMYAINESKNVKINDEDILQALSKANCDFIFRMKKGIHTQIGEKGIRLSGGERQRLAIAKLFLKNPEIIILDEPTSALDSFSEEMISKALEELFVGRTTIIIAHRLQTVRHADKIIVLDQGKIVEVGNHESLVAQKGIYSEMLTMQSGL